MGCLTCMGANTQCSFGAAPSTLMVMPQNKTFSPTPSANIMDNKPMANVMPFGMCMSPSNPTVAAATAAALGVLTPMPCIPSTPGPWMPGAPTTLIGNMPALDNSSKLMCIWGGVISFVYPGQTTTQV